MQSGMGFRPGGKDQHASSNLDGGNALGRAERSPGIRPVHSRVDYSAQHDNNCAGHDNNRSRHDYVFHSGDHGHYSGRPDYHGSAGDNDAFRQLARLDRPGQRREQQPG